MQRVKPLTVREHVLIVYYVWNTGVTKQPELAKLQL